MEPTGGVVTVFLQQKRNPSPTPWISVSVARKMPKKYEK